MNKNCIKPWVASVMIMQSLNAMAMDEVPIAYLLVAKSYQIPADIFYAMALAESGRSYQGELKPWPWALNIDGRSAFCESKQDAEIRANQAIRRKQSVDVGLMQISWRWHQQRFLHVDDALVPINNLRAGAVILKEQYSQSNDWWDAVGRYHDPGQDPISIRNAERYRERVRHYWQGNL